MAPVNTTRYIINKILKTVIKVIATFLSSRWRYLPIEDHFQLFGNYNCSDTNFASYV